MSATKNKTYAIGYGKPPEGQRFTKGQSGNPTGRPKRGNTELVPPSTRDLFLDIMKREITIREGETSRKISTKEAVLRAHVTTAMKGNALAQRDVTQFAMRCEKEAEDAHWENLRFWAGYKYEKAALIAQGHPADELLPHPDDIIVHDSGHITFNGPVSQTHKVAIDNAIAIREAMLIKIALDERSLQPENPKDPLQAMSQIWALAIFLDRSLPPRFRWNDDDRHKRLMYYSFLQKRCLNKVLQDAIKDTPDAKALAAIRPMSIRSLLIDAGCRTTEEYFDHLNAEAQQALNRR